MKRLITLVLLTFFVGILLNTNIVKADHMLGADMSWTCKSDSSFTVTLTVYRDCNGIPMGAAPFTIVPQCANETSKQFSLTGSLYDGADVTPVCHKSCDRCTNSSCSFPFGIQQWKESITLNLSSFKCCKFELQWEECCRSADISTGATWVNFYINNILDKCDTPCDNSPYFTNPPLAIICVNQCFVFNQGVNDINVDGQGNADSLVYKLVPPLTGEGQSTPWNNPYNYKEPLKYSGAFGNPTGGKWDPAHKICNGFHLDSLTGDLYFKPVKQDVTVIAIAVQAWKKDKLGKPYLAQTIRRDVQVGIIQCPSNHVPTLTGFNGTNTVVEDYCVNQKKCYKIISYDQDAPDTVTMSWNGAIPGATFTANNKQVKHPIGEFCWQPKQSRSYPYYFVVNAQDNACPVNGRTSRSYAIVVHPSPEATHTATVDKCGVVTFSAHPVIGKNIPGIVSYQWTGQGNPVVYSTADSFSHKYRIWGTYHYTLTVTSKNGCSYSYNDSVVIPKSVEIFLPTNDTILCQNTTMTIPTTTTLGTSPYSWSWDCSNSTANKINYTFSSGHDTAIVVHVSDQQGCTNYDSMKVHVTIPPQPLVPLDTYACSGSVVTLNDRITRAGTHIWQKETSPGNWTTLFSNNDNSYATFNDSGQYKVTVQDSGVANCSGSSYCHVHYNPLLDVSLDTTIACAGDNVTIKAGNGDSLHTKWTWVDITHNNKVLPYTTRYITVRPGTNGIDYQVTAVQTENGVTCTASNEKRVTSVPKPKIVFTTIPIQCINGGLLDLDYYASPPGVAHSWVGEGKAANATNGSYFNPSIAGPSPKGAPYKLKYTVRSQYGCVDSGFTQIEVDTVPVVSVMNDTTCSAQSSVTLQGLPAGGIWTGYKVRETKTGSGIYNFYPAEAGPGVYKLKYAYSEPSGAKCTLIDSMEMLVYQTPTINITPPGSVCANSGLKPLSATPYPGGTWSCPKAPTALDPVNSTFDPSIPAPGTYTIYYSYGYKGGPSGQPGYYCSAIDSSTITINPIPTINSIGPQNVNYCVNSGAQPLQSNPSGGSWSGPGINGTYFEPSIAYATGTGPYTLKYHYTDPATTCSNSLSMNVGVDDTASLHVTSGNFMCQGNTFTLSAKVANAAGIRWRRYPDGTHGGIGDSTANPTTFTDLSGDDAVGYVQLEAQLVNNAGNVCVAPDSIFKVQIESIDPSFKVDPISGCSPLTVNIIDESSNVAQYFWNFGDGTTDSNTTGAPKPHTYTNTGTTDKPFNITLTGRSLDGCPTTTLPITVTVHPSPVPYPEAKPNITQISLPTIKFTGSGSLGYNSSSVFTWNFGDKSKTSAEINPEHVYSDTGSYMATLRIKNGNGCSAEDSTPIRINPELLVYIPNAFSPNGIGPKQNEVFNVVAEDFSSYDMKIYNRWGQMLYETTDIKKGWDGKFDGQFCQDDVYVYVVKIIANTGRKYSYTGTVTLLK